MTHKVGAKGQVVLPKEMRDEFGIEPGDEVEFDRGDGEIRVRKSPAKTMTLDDLVGFLRDDDDPVPLTAALEAEHRWEIARDELREAEWARRAHEQRPSR
jgi:AbrB family looped-hinge helix DNA binding protein